MATKVPAKPPTQPVQLPKTDDGGAVVVERKTEKVKPPQMYQVVMLNDDYTPMEFVVVVIQEFFSKDLEAATQIMLKIHLEGRGVCGVYTKDVAATKVDLGDPSRRGSFREDLYYRINEATIRIPSLKERQGDTVVLARWFLQRFAQQLNRPIKGFTQKALEAIEQYSWPGNVRELENRVKRAIIMADGALLTEQDLEMDALETNQQPFNLREVREAAECQAVLRALNFSDNNVSHTADMLGITRPTLYNLMRKYNVSV